MAASREGECARADTKDHMTAEPMTRIINADQAAVEAAARCLAEGGLLAFPTETVYGLGADACNGEAIARLYEAKGRPAFNPLICHVPDLAAAGRLGGFDAAATRLAEALWPGPLTLVVPKLPDCGVAELATAGLQTIALRVPDHPVAHAILKEFGKPVVAPSANRSGHISPTTAAHVLADLRGRIDLIVDGGPTPVGVESTIVACLDQPVLLRPGGLPRAEIERALGHPLAEASPEGAVEASAAPMAPGQLASHYAPHAALRLDAWSVHAGESLLAFGPVLPPGSVGAARVLNLSERGDLIEAAANLFSHLRALDAPGVTMIAVMRVPHQGLGEAINDRLRRAQAPRGQAPQGRAPRA
jgi:L-threonylcarbamoyladenylate synthase